MKKGRKGGRKEISRSIFNIRDKEDVVKNGSIGAAHFLISRSETTSFPGFSSHKNDWERFPGNEVG